MLQVAAPRPKVTSFAFGDRHYLAFSVEAPKVEAPTVGPAVLSAAERAVVELAVEGFTNEAIARATGRAVRTVVNLLARASRKLGVRRRVELAGALAMGAPTPPRRRR